MREIVKWIPYIFSTNQRPALLHTSRNHHHPSNTAIYHAIPTLNRLIRRAPARTKILLCVAPIYWLRVMFKEGNAKSSNLFDKINVSPDWRSTKCGRGPNWSLGQRSYVNHCNSLNKLSRNCVVLLGSLLAACLVVYIMGQVPRAEQQLNWASICAELKGSF